MRLDLGSSVWLYPLASIRNTAWRRLTDVLNGSLYYHITETLRDREMNNIYRSLLTEIRRGLNEYATRPR